MALNKGQLNSLRWIAKQDELAWCGVFDHGGDDVVRFLEGAGLIEGVKQPVMSGRATFSGGYRITPAGRDALEKERVECSAPAENQAKCFPSSARNDRHEED